MEARIYTGRPARHGHCRSGTMTPEYRAWIRIHERCYKPENTGYKNYGGRGIQVCLRWHRSTPNAFENFLSDMGNRPIGKSIDRINNDLSYMPSNCRWATPKEQANNRRHGNQWGTGFESRKGTNE